MNSTKQVVEDNKTTWKRQLNNTSRTTTQHVEGNNTTHRGQHISTTAIISTTTIINNAHTCWSEKYSYHWFNCISFYKAPRRHSWCFKVPVTSLVYTLKMCMYIKQLYITIYSVKLTSLWILYHRAVHKV